MSEEQAEYKINKLPKINNKIKDILSKKGITQNNFAAVLNMSVSNVSNIINNKTQVSLPLAFKISYILREPIEDIFYHTIDDNEFDTEYVKEDNNNVDFYMMRCILLTKDCKTENDVKEQIQNKNKTSLFNIKLTKIDNEEID